MSIFYLLWSMYYFFLIQKIISIDKDLIKPSDYSIQVSGFELKIDDYYLFCQNWKEEARELAENIGIDFEHVSRSVFICDCEQF